MTDRGPVGQDRDRTLPQGLAVRAEPLPTGFAELDISLGPAGRAHGRVPPEQAHHFITTFGVLGSVVTGITGAVLTLHVAPGLTGVALVEMVLALAAALLIAFGGRVQGRLPDDRGGPGPA